MFRLLVKSGSGDSFERELDDAELTVGRSASAGLALPDRYLSREHARFSLRDGGVWLEDLGSRNGTFVNEVRIDGSTPVSVGDSISMSDTVLTLLSDAPAPEAAAFDAEASVFVPASELVPESFDLDATVFGSGDVHRHLQRLRLLDEVHRSLARSISLEDLLDLILDRLFELLDPEEGVVFLARGEGRWERVAERRAPGLERNCLYSKTLIEEVAGKRQAALVLDALADERFAGAESIMASGVRSIAAAPLVVDDDSLGLIAVSSNLAVRKFEERDLELLGSLASVAALRIRNVSLAGAAAERYKLEAEIALARDIQETLLRQRLPVVPGFDVFALNHPSQGVSGDLYQVRPTQSADDFFLFLFDVSGKGLAASLLTATIEALAANPITRNLEPDWICARVNDQLEQRTLPDRFATAFLARLNTATGTLTYANAGHNPALVVRAAGGVEHLGRTGLPLAVLPGSGYEARSVELAEGDLLVIYSDGITEATNPNRDEYGLDRLERVCADALDSEIGAVAERIEASVEDFAAGTPYDDDQTLLLVRRRGPV